MRRLTRTLSLGLAAFIFSLAFGSAAWATSSVRIEWLRNGHIYSAETVTSADSATSARSGAAPAGTSLARVTVTAGAVVVLADGGTAPTANQVNGLFLQTCSQPATFTIQAADKIAIIESTIGNVCPSGGGGGGASSTATAAAPIRSEGATNQPQSQDLHGSTRVLNIDATGNPLDPAAPSNCGPTSTFVQCPTKAGQPTLDANGASVIPESAAPTVTKTTLTANLSQTICPTATHPVTTEIYLNTAPSNLGLGLRGQSLSTDAWGTGSTAADILLTAAGQYYSSPVAYNTAITGRSAGTPSVTCVQTLRQ